MVNEHFHFRFQRFVAVRSFKMAAVFYKYAFELQCQEEQISIYNGSIIFGQFVHRILTS